jgi:hypothetical protein
MVIAARNEVIWGPFEQHFFTLVNTIPTHAITIKTRIVLKNQALHMFRPANWPSSG